MLKRGGIMLKRMRKYNKGEKITYYKQIILSWD